MKPPRSRFVAWFALGLIMEVAVSGCEDPGCADPNNQNNRNDQNNQCGQCSEFAIPPLPDAAVDAGPDASDASLDFGFDRDAYLAPRQPCDATEIQLPPSGDTMVTPPSMWAGKVVYADSRFGGDLGVDVFLYDLNSCLELAITRADWHQLAFSISGDDVIIESRGHDTCVTDMFVFDVRTGAFQWLPAPSFGAPERFNGRHLVYSSWSADGCVDNQSLVLWDLFTEKVMTLAEPWQAAEGNSISPTHAAWVANGGPGKDVFFVDLATYDVVQVESTFDPEVWWTATWGDWVLWEDLRNGPPNIYGLRISTGEELRLTDNGAGNGMPTLRGNLACYRTTEWNNTGWDLAVMDLETGIRRRVTRTPDSGYKCGPVDSGWLVYERQKWAQYWANEIWAVDLVAAGILDEAGETVLPEP